MRVNSKEFLFICFLTTGLILISLHHFNSSGDANNTISICKTNSQSDAKRHRDCIPDYDEVDQELASYPWIGDPSCRHFAVQVKRLF
jgi:hypothetical protein